MQPQHTTHNAPLPAVTRVCPQCDNPFRVNVWVLRQGHGKYCCKHCADLARAARPFAERFWEKVAKSDGCWLWTGGCSNTGYGAFWLKGQTINAHRIAWLLTSGPIPDGMDVLHRCDANYSVGDRSYRRCVRPDHLFLGTDKDNMADMVAKGRSASGERHGSHTHPEKRARGDASGPRLHPERMPRGDRSGAHTHPEKVTHGEDHPMAKLTNEQARQIRERYAAGGISYAALAREFGVSSTPIHQIIKGISYKLA
jgi:hypothetical protein